MIDSTKKMQAYLLNPFNGFYWIALVRHSLNKNPWWCPGYKLKSVKPVCSLIFGWQIVIVSVIRADLPEYKLSTVNWIASLPNWSVETNVFVPTNRCFQSVPWAGEYIPGELVSVRYKGKFVGDLDVAIFLLAYDIQPETAESDDNVCTIGFSDRHQAWFGWSHRAYQLFRIGDRVEEGDNITVSGYTTEYLSENPEKDLTLPVGFEAKTLEDCKRMAIAFADSVG
jgi:hypothetical protein